MSQLRILLLGALTAIAFAVGALVSVNKYGNKRYEAGYNAAITAGQVQLASEAAENLKIESDLRAQLAERDADAHRKEQEYASNLADAQRRVRAGTDRLRCPTSPVQPAATPADRPAAASASTSLFCDTLS